MVKEKDTKKKEQNVSDETCYKCKKPITKSEKTKCWRCGNHYCKACKCMYTHGCY